MAYKGTIKVIPFTVNGREVLFFKDAGRVHCLVEAECNGVKHRFHFYRSSGTNAKSMHGKEYTKEELKGRWFLALGVTFHWIAKVDGNVPTLIDTMANIVFNRYNKTIVDNPSAITNLTKEYRQVINNIMPIEPVCPGDGSKDTTNPKWILACHVAKANFNYAVAYASELEATMLRLLQEENNK